MDKVGQVPPRDSLKVLSSPVTEQFDPDPLTFDYRMGITQGSRAMGENYQYTKAFASYVH